MFINSMFCNYKNMINKLFCCIIVCSMIWQSVFLSLNINCAETINENITVQNDIFSAVFVIEKTINEFTCSIVGSIFKQTSKEENKTQKSSTPSNFNELSIVSVFQFNEFLNLYSQTMFYKRIFLFDMCGFYQADVGFIKNTKIFTVYFLEMLLKYSFSSIYGDYNINNIYINSLRNPV